MSFAAAPALLSALREADLLAAVAAPARGGPRGAARTDRDLAREVARGVPLRGAGVPEAAERALATAWLSASHARVRAASRAVPASRWGVGAPGRWSAAQVVEHLVRTERVVLAFVRGPLLDAPRELALLVGSDAALVERLADRRRAQRCPEGLAPADDGVPASWRAPAPLLDALEAARAATIGCARTSEEPLRAHAAPHPELGLLDGWQWILFLAAHADRHAAQLWELARPERRLAA